MSELKNRLIGKIVKTIDPGIDDWGIGFTDGSGFGINTKIEATLFSAQGEMVVTDVRSTEDMVEILLGKMSYIRIILDADLLIGPEYFVFQDTDGSMFVEN